MRIFSTIGVVAVILALVYLLSHRTLSHGQAVSLWPAGHMPGDHCREPEGVIRKDGVYMVINVSQPTLEIFKAASDKPTPAVIICPGGGYDLLAYDREGTEAATWLQSIGITGIILKYRVPENRDGAYQDIQRAFRLVRKNAASWNIDPNKLGAVGFSAGGHLAARLSSNFGTPAYASIDDADSLSCHPDYVILVYPAYLNAGAVVAPDVTPGRQTSPTLIVHDLTDTKYEPGSKIYDAALTAAQVPHEFQLYPDGGHGFGLRSWKSVRVWPQKAGAWLQERGILPATPATPISP